jgi:methylamine dehydrogenase accessory protein MauD
MMTALLLSVVLQWIVIVVLAGVVFALTRQIGVLYERVAPAGALMIGRGVVVGEAAPAVRASRLDGETEMVGAPSVNGLATLVFFLSPTCPVCKSLLPALRSMAHAEASSLRILLAGDGAPDEYRTFVRREKIEGFPLVLSTQLGMTWQIAKLPYAVLLDESGIVRSHGIVNSREHLESLVEARERGVASIQEYFGAGRSDDPGDPHAGHIHSPGVISQEPSAYGAAQAAHPQAPHSSSQGQSTYGASGHGALATQKTSHEPAAGPSPRAKVA